MMGEVGNHSFGVGLGILYAVFGGIVGNSFGFGDLGVFLFVLALFLLTSILIAFLRRKNLEAFIKKNLKIQDPNFGDYTMAQNKHPSGWRTRCHKGKNDKGSL